MPARKGATTVADLLSSVSRSGASSQQERHAQQLWALVQAGDQDVVEGVLDCTSRLLINGGVRAHAARCHDARGQHQKGRCALPSFWVSVAWS